MTSLQSIRSRIRSIRSTEKITKAMKLVAAAKFRQNQSSIKVSEDFYVELKRCIASSLNCLKDTGDLVSIPFFKDESRNAVSEFFVVTSDKGLCGSFNSNLIKEFLNQKKSFKNSCKINSIGIKGLEILNKSKIPIEDSYSFNNLLSKKTFDFLNSSISNYLSGEVSEVFIMYTHFRSAFKQEICLKKILPLDLNNFTDNIEDSYIQDTLLESNLQFLLTQYVFSQFYLAFLHSITSENCARMNAMENANKNAKGLIGKLTLIYNQARQANITKEILEIISGAESIKVDCQ